MENQILLSGITPTELKELIINGVKEELSNVLTKPEPPKEVESGYLSVKEACEFLKCSTTKLWRYRKNNKLSSHKFGRSILFKKHDLENLLFNLENKKGVSNDR